VPEPRLPVPGDAHEWVSFADPSEDRTWMFDVTFLTSRWRCIYGQGCQGVLTGPAPELEQGCCSYGAHFTGVQDALAVEAAAARLTDLQWQFRHRGRKGTVKRLPDGDLGTRMADGACIFLNRPGFPGGAGCALHRAALEAGQSPVQWKPEVCWQLPLRREDETAPDGHVTSTVRQWDRRHWGAGGDEFHWWCTEAPEAFTGDRPVYEEMARELVAMAGKPVYRRLVAYLRTKRWSGGAADGDDSAVTPVVPLPHPTVRARA
jgi:hypothetical protein